jgi:hypothetical protein
VAPFVVINLAGLLLLIPLIKVTFPLAQVWWRTRSPESLRAHAAKSPKASPGQDRAAGLDEQEPPEATLGSLTNQLGAVESLSDQAIEKIVTQHFGSKGQNPTGSTGFDMDSAVFDSISRTNVVLQGQAYYGYRVKLVDQNGNYQTNIDCFLEPNQEYERSLAAMEMINQSPQLKRIYQAMAASLAEKASQSEPAPGAASDQPALRLVPEAPSANP